MYLLAITCIDKGSQASIKQMVVAKKNVHKSSKKNDILPMIYKKNTSRQSVVIPANVSTTKKINTQHTPSLTHYSTRFNSKSTTSLNSARYLTLIGVTSSSDVNFLSQKE
eukprot:TRINITY_DN22620_c0_g1_i1.p1 TRINITY_DN22620_c0_g1~~TRINITY_DN22620_c0_g1_i1.p1  ORF type:complete len:110 (-),score=0.67 TRINITY_DN22620_c0_g1_i1:162-491(-)